MYMFLMAVRPHGGIRIRNLSTLFIRNYCFKRLILTFSWERRRKPKAHSKVKTRLQLWRPPTSLTCIYMHDACRLSPSTVSHNNDNLNILFSSLQFKFNFLFSYLWLKHPAVKSFKFRLNLSSRFASKDRICCPQWITRHLISL